MSDITTLPVLIDDTTNGFSRYLRQINSIPSLTQEEEFLLAKDYLEKGNLGAAHRLVLSHLKLVAKVALKYKNYGLPVTELVSEGNLGLMQAVKKYDPDLGYRLSTYAMWWIKAAIQEYVLRSWSLVKIGTTAAQKKLFFGLGKIKRKITNRHSRNVNESDYDTIARELGVSRQEVSEMSKRMAGQDISLNNPLNKDGTLTEMIDILPENKPSSEITLMNKEDLSNKKLILLEAINILNEREAEILKARKLTDNPSTLDILSEKYKISKERVRQIENRAFEKVQNYVLSHISRDGEFIRI